MPTDTNTPPVPQLEGNHTVTRADVTLRLHPALTGKGKDAGKAFLNLETSGVTFDTLVTFIGKDSAQNTLSNMVRRFCLNVSDKFRDAQTKLIDIEKVKNALTNMAIARVTLSQLEDELTAIGSELLDYDPEIEYTPEYAMHFINLRRKGKALRQQILEIKAARAEAQDGEGDGMD